METQKFKTALAEMLEFTEIKNIAYMCSEAVWWKCHRSLISDELKVQGWKVLHILNKNKVEEHPFTKAAKVVDGMLNYRD